MILTTISRVTKNSREILLCGIHKSTQEIFREHTHCGTDCSLPVLLITDLFAKESVVDNPQFESRCSMPLYVPDTPTTLVDFQLDAQNSYLFTYDTFIKILYMLRALPCSSSGDLVVIVHMRPLVSSFSAGDCPVHRLRKNSSSFLTGAQDSHLQRMTTPEAAYIQLRLRLPEDEQGNARNM